MRQLIPNTVTQTSLFSEAVRKGFWSQTALMSYFSLTSSFSNKQCVLLFRLISELTSGGNKAQQCRMTSQAFSYSLSYESAIKSTICSRSSEPLKPTPSYTLVRGFISEPVLRPCACLKTCILSFSTWPLSIDTIPQKRQTHSLLSILNDRRV